LTKLLIERGLDHRGLVYAEVVGGEGGVSGYLEKNKLAQEQIDTTWSTGGLIWKPRFIHLDTHSKGGWSMKITRHIACSLSIIVMFVTVLASNKLAASELYYIDAHSQMIIK
jgi:hypothetical protein